LLVFALLVFPVFVYIMQVRGATFWSYWFDSVVVKRQIEFAHLWFVAHLLVYACLYAIWRRLRPAAPVGKRDFPANKSVLAYALLLALTSMIVRIWYPIDRWVTVLVPMELAHMPQYASLFVIGILAYRHQWLGRIPAAAGRLWLAVGLAAVVARYAYTISGARFLARGAAGPRWTPIVWNCWEALLCTGMCVGLLYVFRERFNAQSAFGRALARNAYAVYLVHLPLVVLVQFALEGTAFGPLTLFALATMGGLALSFAVSEYGVRRIPGAARVV
ncbi:MAG: acyltransferase family protein, partial [Acidobacteria bacterium]|nr:acyltransferase family protein [Acidobacteriota bacterium]